MRAPDGQKYIVILTFPTGKKFAVGDCEGKLAMLSIEYGEKPMTLRGVLAFDDSMEVSKWMKAFLKGLSEEQRNVFLSLRPDLALVTLAQ